MMSLYSWFADDITWCVRNNCPVMNCRRNPVNMIDRTGLHSYAMFAGTPECPVSCSLDVCIDGCIHAKECFSSCDDPDEALRKLQDKYCEYCEFSSLEED